MAAPESAIETIWEPAQIFAEDDAIHKKIHASFGIVVLNQPMTLASDVYRRVWQNGRLGYTTARIRALHLPLQAQATIVNNADLEVGIFQIAADGGANRLLDLNHYPDKLCLAHRLEFSKNYSGAKLSKEQPILDIDVIIGDLDSLSDDATEFWKSKHAQIQFVDDQDSTDFTKAVNYIRDWTEEKEESFMSGRRLKTSQVTVNKSLLPPKDIVCIGGIAGRIDQGISQLHHLYMFQNDPSYKAGRMFLLSSEAITFVLKTGNHKIRVQDPWLGKHIGIIPLKEPSRITTSGLVWDVEDWPTSFGTQISTSNAPKEDSVWIDISTTKDVLFTIDLASPPPESPRCTLGKECQFDEYESLVKNGDR